MLTFAHLLFKLLVAHALCDYPFQGDFLSRGKRRVPVPGTSTFMNAIVGVPWYQCLLAHAFIQAGGVYVVTGSLAFAVAELVLHAAIDFFKCEGHLTFNEDQALHVICKIVYAGWMI